MKINKKKIAGICPVGMRKTVCPSIKKTRQTRIKLLALQRQKNLDTDQVIKLQSLLKERKKQGVAGDCESCSFNTPANTSTYAPQ